MRCGESGFITGETCTLACIHFTRQILGGILRVNSLAHECDITITAMFGSFHP